MSEAQRSDWSEATMTAITPEELLAATHIGFGLHLWHCEGGAIPMTTDKLKPILEEAYDPSMPDWPSLIIQDGRFGLRVA
jgi:hypothetical protein